MPQADESFAILVCSCGKRLKAPNALPGRVGKCPSCGGTLTAPGLPVELPTELPDPIPPTHDPTPERHPPRVGTTVKKSRKNRGAIGREGLVKLPRRSDPSLAANLLYPLWDGHGVSMLVFLPPVLWLTSCMSIGLVPWYVVGAELVMKMGTLTMVAPMTAILLMTIGYVLTFLHGVIRLSAEGDMHHPRVPSWKIAVAFSSLFKTVCSLFVGALISGPFIAVYLLTVREGLVLRDGIVLGWLAAPGLAFALLALAAAVVQDNVIAASPLALAGDIGRVGSDAVRLLAITAVWSGINLTLGICLFLLHTIGLWATILGVWLFWVLTMYAMMVLCRLTGLMAYEHARELGWTSGESRWKV